MLIFIKIMRLKAISLQGMFNLLKVSFLLQADCGEEYIVKQEEVKKEEKI